MKALVASLLIVAATISVSLANAADSSDRPAGIEAQNWIPISDRLGFVVVDKAERFPAATGSRQLLIAPPENVSADLMPPKKGYFVVKTQNGWQRLVVSEPSELVG